MKSESNNFSLEEIFSGSNIANLNINEIISKILNISTKIIFILIISHILIKVSNVFCNKLFSKNHLLSESENKTLERTIAGVLKGIIFFVALSNIMAVFNVDMTSLLAVAGVGSIAIGFAAQGLVRDFLTGSFIILEKQYNIGDLIEVNGIRGTVEDITMRITKIRSFNGSLHIIPNGEITMVTSMSKDFTNAIVNIGVAYNEEIDDVLELMKAELSGLQNKNDNLLTDPEILGISEFNDNYINVLIYAKCKPSTHFSVEREIRLIIRNLFEKNGITAPIAQKIISIKEGRNGL